MTPPPDPMFMQRWNQRLRQTPNGGFSLPADFVAEQGRSVHLVDIRTPEEALSVGYIPGSVIVPEAELDAALSEAPNHLPVVLVSRSGETASLAARRIRATGFELVAALEGGMVAWKLMGYAIGRDRAVLDRRPRWHELELAAELPERVLESGRRVLSLGQITEHVGDPMSVRWVRVAALLLHGKVSCVDGRDERGVVGTPGGDAGEFLLAVAATESVIGRPFTVAEIQVLLEIWADAFGRFYMHTDLHAIEVLYRSLEADPQLRPTIEGLDEGGRRRFLLNVPANLRDRLLEHLVIPEHLGCGHLRLMAQGPDEYGVRPGLVADYLRAFFPLWWSGNPELTMTALGGGHAEAAVVNVHLDAVPLPFSSVPMLSPLCAGSQMFVNHPDVAAYLRNQAVSLLVRHSGWVGPDDGPRLQSAMSELATQQLGRTLAHLARELPLYQVYFARDRSFRVAED